MYEAELFNIQESFISGCVHSLPQTTNLLNMPPVAHCSVWARGLLDRAICPLLYMHKLQSPILTCEAFARPLELFSEVSCALKSYERSTVSAWVQDIAARVDADILNHPLLRLSEHNTLLINFEPVWLDLLQTSKTLASFGSELPEYLQSICKHRDSIYHLHNQLLCVTFMYNSIFNTMENDAIWPLMRKSLNKIKAMTSPALIRVTWNSHGAMDFVSRLYHAIESNYSILKQVTGKIGKIMESVAVCGEQHLFIRNHQRTFGLCELKANVTCHLQGRYAVFMDCMLAIQREMESVMFLVGANSTMSEWVKYAEQIFGSVRNWLERFVESELIHFQSHLERQCNESSIFTPCPMVEVELHLDESKNKVLFIPPIEDTMNGNGVVSTALDWMEKIVNLISKMEFGLDESRLNLVANESNILQLQGKIKSTLQQLNSICEQFRSTFLGFSFLWNQNENSHRLKLFQQLDSPNLTSFPDLNHYEKVMCDTERMTRELLLKEDFSTVWWIRIDVRPLKTVIVARLREWRDSHVSSLLSFTSKRISNIERIVRFEQEELKAASSRCVGETNFISVLEVLQRIRGQGKFIDESFEPLSKTIDFLSLYVSDLGLTLKLTNVMTLWAELQKLMLQVKEKHIHLTIVETEKLRTRTINLKSMMETTIISVKEASHLDCNDDNCVESTLSGAYSLIAECNKRICAVLDEIDDIENFESLLEHKILTEKSEIDHLWSELKWVKNLWDLLSLISFTFTDWSDMVWKDVNCDHCLTFTSELLEYTKAVEQAHDATAALSYVKTKVLLVHQTLLSLSIMQDSNIRPRHWMYLVKLTNKSVNYSEQMRFKDIVAMDLYNISHEVLRVAEGASREHVLESQVERVEIRWKSWKFATNFSDQFQLTLLDQVSLEKSVLDLQEEQVFLQNLQAMKVEFMSESIESWQRKLATLEFTLLLLMEIQDSFLRILFYFSIKRLNSEQVTGDQQFRITRQDVKEIMSIISQNVAALDVVVDLTFVSKIKNLKSQLNNDEQALSEWLSSKRRAFTRFYFLCDSELFSLLSNGTESPKRFMHLIPKMFEGISALQFASRTTASGNEVQGIIGIRKEILPFENEIPFSQNLDLEAWFHQLTKQVCVESG